MIKGLLFTLMLAGAVQAQEEPANVQVETLDTEISARSRVLELAGAFSNDGYKIRDGFWAGNLEPDRPKFLEVNLFSGNEYWFSGAATPPARQIGIQIYDAKGQPVKIQTYEDGPVAAAGFVPEVSGQYFVGIRLLSGEKSEFCLLYSYK